MSGEEFAIKFNFQKLWGLGIDEGDIARIAQSLNCPLEWAEEIIMKYKMNTLKHAEMILQGSRIAHLPDNGCQKTIAFIGDSITSDRESYYNIIKTAFSEYKAISLIDAAVSGDRSSNALVCLHERVIKHRPDIVSIMIGTNDIQKSIDSAGICATSTGEYERNLRHIIERLLAEKSSVIINTLPPMDSSFDYSYGEGYRRYEPVNLLEYNAIIRKLSCEYRLVLNDLSEEYAKYSAEKLLLDDGIHLSPFAQCIVAARLFTILIGMLER